MEKFFELGKVYHFEFKKEDYYLQMGMDRASSIRLLTKRYGREEDLHKIFENWGRLVTEAIEENGLPVKKGLFELLEYLDKKGYKKAVASSTAKDKVIKYLELAGIGSCFDLIVSGEDFRHSKPYPDIFLYTCKKLGIHYENAIVLEDSYNGILAANRAHILSVAVPDLLRSEKLEELSPYKIVDSLLYIPDLLKELALSSH